MTTVHLSTIFSYDMQITITLEKIMNTNDFGMAETTVLLSLVSKQERIQLQYK